MAPGSAAAAGIPSGGDDERLLIEAAKADPSRFAELFYAFVARRAGSRGEAEDLTSEVFHQALANLDRHAKIRVGGSVIEMGEAHGEWGPMPTMFYVYVDDVDAWYRRAIAAGATAMEAPALQPYGERRAAVRDAFDNQWYLAAPA